MSDDILKRLRRWAHSGGCGCTRCTAANEIETLIAALDTANTIGAENALKLAKSIREREILSAENKRLEALDKDWLRASEQWVAENERLENRLNLAFEMLNDHGVDNAAIMKHIKSLMERVSTEQTKDGINDMPDPFTCPECGEPTDNGHDRCFPPNPYVCTKCMEQERV